MPYIRLGDITIDPNHIATATDYGYYVTIDVQDATGYRQHAFTGTDAEDIRVQLAAVHLPFRDDPDLRGAPREYRPCLLADAVTQPQLSHLNRVELIGHIGQAPESVYACSGLLLCYFLLRVPNMLGDAIAQFQQGSYEWFQIYTLGTTAEYAATLPRGTPVFIQRQLVGQNLDGTPSRSRDAADGDARERHRVLA